MHLILIHVFVERVVSISTVVIHTQKAKFGSRNTAISQHMQLKQHEISDENREGLCLEIVQNVYV